MKERVLLRAASGPTVGMGHVVRTAAVAQAVRARGGEPLLIVDDEVSARRIRARFDLAAVLDDGDGAWCAEPARAAWLDGFRDWTRELELLSARRTPAFLVENRRSPRHLAARVVYPALHHRDDAWDRAHPSRVLAGPRWIPLAESITRTPRAPERDVDLLITFGGSDPQHLTERVLAALAGHGGRIVVSVGAHMAPRREELLRLARAVSPAAEVLSPGADLAPWMARSRAAVTALGTTLYELAFLGTPALILANYAQDADALAHYAEHGPHAPLGVAAALSDGALRTALGRAIATIGERSDFEVDGLSAGGANLAEALFAGCADRTT